MPSTESMNRFTCALVEPGTMRSARAIRVSFSCASRNSGFQSDAAALASAIANVSRSVKCFHIGWPSVRPGTNNAPPALAMSHCISSRRPTPDLDAATRGSVSLICFTHLFHSKKRVHSFSSKSAAILLRYFSRMLTPSAQPFNEGSATEQDHFQESAPCTRSVGCATAGSEREGFWWAAVVFDELCKYIPVSRKAERYVRPQLALRCKNI